MNRAESRPARLATGEDLLSLAACSLAFCFWTYRAQGTIRVAEALTLTGFALISWTAGRGLLAALGVDRVLDRAFPFVFLTGVSAVSFATSLLHIGTSLGVRGSYLIVTVAAFGLFFIQRERITDWVTLRVAERQGFYATAMTLLAATFWLQHCWPQRLAQDGVVRFRVFDEYYSNTVNMTPLLSAGNPFSWGSIHYAGESLSFYHWACYLPAAVLHIFGGQPANDTMTTLWFPLGMALMGWSAYSLAQVLFHRRAAFWAAALVMAVPDPTYWLSDIIVFSFDRLIEASAGMGYASGAAAVAVALTTLGVRHGQRRLLAAGVIGGFASCYFKVNIIVAVLPAILMVLVLGRGRLTRGARAGWIVGLLLTVLACYFAASRLRSAPTFRLDPNWGASFLDFVVMPTPGSSFVHAGMRLVDGPADPASVVARAGLVVAATFQILPLIYATLLLGATAAGKRLGWPHLLIVASLAFYGFLAVALAPNENGDPFELQHRAFCWYYLLLAAGIADAAVALLSVKAVRRFAPLAIPLGVCLLWLPFAVGRQSAMPVTELSFSSGFVNACEFVRRHAAKDDVVLDSINDPWLVTIALTERRAFVCRDPNYNFPGSGALKETREARWRAADQLFRFDRAPDIADWGRQHGVRWVILHPRTPVRWPESVLAKPAFSSAGYRVIDLSSL